MVVGFGVVGFGVVSLVEGGVEVEEVGEERGWGEVGGKLVEVVVGVLGEIG